ncbi:PepSY-associated TM helix domain-containing protein [Cyclobacterium plantarum]|uniref:PepSY domain-containing protein n=1 Tax=Cyclobacterium plantarum TaxID=2716263 RepID=A0ABX0HAZ4_9BACT|nr:PepSY-associated TM helix domain-containing protein [Cyclobacterium plantarum]NHE57611.1 PepSY domain-containing protein [Cyclobacterium plantarum]
MSFRKFLTKIHLFLGLSIGLLFTIISLSGALYSWEPELSRIAYKQDVDAKDSPFVSISQVRNTLQKNFPEGDFRTALYRDPESSIEVLLYAPGTYYLAQLNPYTAELIHLQDMNKGWLNSIKKLHRNLLLGNVGREIVHWVTLLALPLLISGLVIWWPIRGWPGKSNFRINWYGSPKRKNRDLHTVLGFYATWILIFAIITGIYWGFSTVRETIKQLSGENKMNWESPHSELPDTGQLAVNDDVLNRLIAEYHKTFSESEVRISIPHEKDDPIHLSVIEPKKGINAIDHYYHDQYTGEQIEGHFLNGLSSERSSFQKINGMVYDIHFGSILGLPGRMLVFFAALVAASLPITGFIIWSGKKYSLAK